MLYILVLSSAPWDILKRKFSQGKELVFLPHKAYYLKGQDKGLLVSDVPPGIFRPRTADHSCKGLI